MEDWLSGTFLSPEDWLALRLSLQVAACAVVAQLPLAIWVGHLLARHTFPGKWVLETLVNMPLVLPPVVTGYLLLLCFAPNGPIGSFLADWFGVKIVFHWLGAVLAAMVMSLPLAVRAIRLAFHGVDPRLEMAARSLGAGRLTTFVTITLPLARRGIMAGTILAFARSLGEFGATMMVAGNVEGQTRTIPLAIFTKASRPGGMEKSWGLVLLAIMVACMALAVSEWLERRHTSYDYESA